MNCENCKQALVDYLNNAVNSDEKTLVEKHLAHCPECTAELEALATVQNDFRQTMQKSIAELHAPAHALATIKQRIAQKQGRRIPILSSIKARIAGWWRDLRARPAWQQVCVFVPIAAVVIGSGAAAAVIGFGAKGGPPSTFPYDIIFVSDQYGDHGRSQNIYAIDVDGGNTVNLTDNRSLYYMPAWSPDGSRIVFSSDRDDGNQQEIYVMDADGSNPTRLTYISTNGQYDDNQYPSWSPDGSKIMFRGERGYSTDIYVMDADGSNQINLTNSGVNINSGPVWSPDGSKIAYSSGPDLLDIYVMDADGSNKTKLTSHEGQSSMHHAWSPDGSKIVYISWIDADEINDIYVMDADGSNVIYLTSEDGFPYPVWSPDGTKIAYSGRSGYGRDIYVIDIDGTNKTNLTDTKRDREMEPSWSLDGTKIVYTLYGSSEVFDEESGSWVERGSEIWVMNADGSGQTKLTQSEENAHSAVWSPLFEQQDN